MQISKVDFFDWFVLLVNVCVWKLKYIYFNFLNKFYGNQKSNVVFVLNSGMTNQFHSSFRIHLNFTYFVNRHC
jgi:hypothetical protein